MNEVALNNEIDTNEQIDRLEVQMSQLEAVDCPVTHHFIPGFYCRQILMYAGTLITSLIHNTTHPYVVTKGVVSVFTDEEQEVLIDATKTHHTGITRPGTRRVLFCHTDVIWTTFHPTDIVPVDNSEEAVEEAVERVKKLIIEEHENKYLGGVLKNNVLTKKIENEA